jgi:hypothetical protein
MRFSSNIKVDFSLITIIFFCCTYVYSVYMTVTGQGDSFVQNYESVAFFFTVLCLPLMGVWAIERHERIEELRINKFRDKIRHL